jgi:hypothetical protein
MNKPNKEVEEISKLNETYMESPIFDVFARHFEDADHALELWNELNYKYQS